MKTILNEYYYNGLSNQTCPVSYSNTSLPCDFSKIKFPENAKSMIEEVVWNTGSNEVEISFEKIKTSKFYEYERSNNTGKNCSSVKYCNDDIERTIKWTGKIGLSYPSDYGYATSGGSKINRETCLNTNLYDWYEDMFDSSTIRGISDCYQNDWFYNNGIPQYFMTPYAESNNNSLVFKLKYKTFSIIFTGDIEGIAENEILKQEVEFSSSILKVAHHGSNSSTSQLFLEKVKPKYAIISVGRDNSHNLPDIDIIERLKNNNIKIYRTDENNTIWLTSDGTEIYINPLKYNLDGTGRKQAIFFERKYRLAFFFNCYEYEVIQLF